MTTENKWLEWAKELQFLSQCALAYCKDKFDIERFQRIREISAEMVSELAGLPIEAVKATFCSGSGYQTPKLDTRAAVIREGRILLVQEANGEWALPGGWVDYNLTVRENAAKEVREEAGMEVLPTRLIALHEHNKRNRTLYPHNICCVYILCEYLAGDFTPNTETVACGFFGPEEIPLPLAENKTTRAQIDMCFRAYADPDWQVEFD